MNTFQLFLATVTFVLVVTPALAGLGLRVNNPPCRRGQTSGCDNTRFKPCGTISQSSADLFIGRNSNLNCGSNSVDPYDTNRDILVQFDGSDGCTEILMKSGECWGSAPNGNYDCLGRCGAGCGSWSCSNWGPNCLQHDVCGWYYGSSGGATDGNCGDEFGYAVDDTLTNCLGWGAGACEAADDSISGSSTNAICN